MNTQHTQQQKIEQQQLLMLYNLFPRGAVLGIGSALLVVITFWPVSNSAHLLLWFSALISCYAVRLIHLRWNTRKQQDLRHWLPVFLLGNVVAGSIWGSLAFLYQPNWPFEFQIILGIIFPTVAAGSLTNHAPYFRSLQSFFIPIWIIMSLGLLPKIEPHFILSNALVYVALGLTIMSAGKRQCDTFKKTLLVQQELRSANQMLAEQNKVDFLTGIYNRRAFDQIFRREWQRHKRDNIPLSVLTIDVDYFKNYNDHYGHPQGDRCLIEIAAILKDTLSRASDELARYGGEEFIALLTNSDEQQALKSANKLLSAINQKAILHEYSSVATHITVSIGIATHTPHKDDQPGDFLDESDKALYQAKRNGRNQIFPKHH